jgi:hypothetical protein
MRVQSTVRAAACLQGARKAGELNSTLSASLSNSTRGDVAC